MTDLTPDELTALAAEHKEPTKVGTTICYCGKHWPCPTMRLIEGYEDCRTAVMEEQQENINLGFNIKGLQQRAEAAEAELVRWKEPITSGGWRRFEEVQRAEAEVARLREALEQITKCACDETVRQGHEFHCGAPIARAALSIPVAPTEAVDD